MRYYRTARILLLALLAAAIVGTAAYTGYHLYDLFSHVRVMAYAVTDREEEVMPDGDAQKEEEPLDPFTFLVYGVDAGEWVGDQERDEPGNADTIILANLYPGSGEIALLSIPRDTLASIPGHYRTKINHSHAYGGSELLVETVEDFTGIAVDYYVGFDYPAFRNLVDLMGGIEFYVDRDIVFEGFYLEAGEQKLDGHEAFAVIQGRRDPMGDVDRVRRQQRFLETLAKEISELPLEELFFLGVVTWDQVETNLDIMTGISLANSFTDISAEDLRMEVLPGRFINIDEISYWETDPARNEEVIENLFQLNRSGGGEPGD